MALTIDGHAQAGAHSTTQSVVLTTTMSNDIIVAAVSTNSSSSNDVTSVSGGSLTWHKRGTQTFGTNIISVWWALAPTALSSVTITATLSGTTPEAADMLAFGVNGANLTTPFDVNGSLPAVNNAGSSTSISVTISTTATATMPLLFAQNYEPSTFTAGSGSIITQDIVSQSFGLGTMAQSQTASSPLTSAAITATQGSATFGWAAVADAIQVAPEGLVTTDAPDVMAFTGVVSEPLTVEDVAQASLRSTTSGTITVATGGTDRICVLMIEAENTTNTAPTVTTVTSAHVTWVKTYATAQIVNNDFNGQIDMEVWLGFAATPLSSEVVTVDFSSTVDGAELNYLAIGGSTLTSASFLDTNGSLPAVNVAAPGSVTYSTTGNRSVVIEWSTAGSRSNPFAGASSGFTSQFNYRDNAPPSWDIGVGIATRITSSPDSGVTASMSSSGNSALVVFAIAGDKVSSTGTFEPTDTPDVFDANDFGPPSGTFEPTEAKDTFFGFEAPALGLDTSATGEADGNDLVDVCETTLSTGHPNELIVLVVEAGGHFLSNPPGVVSVTDTAGLTWKKRNARLRGGFGVTLEIWWAIAPDPLSGDVITATVKTSAGASVGYIATSAFGVLGANNDAPWDTNVQAAGYFDTGAVGASGGDPLGPMSRNAATSLNLAIYGASGPPPASANPVTSPFVQLTSGGASEHDGDDGLLIVSTCLSPSPADSLLAGYGTVGGGGFGNRQCLVDTIVAAGEIGTDDAVRWYFDGYNQTTEALTGGGNSTTLNFFSSNANLILQCVILVNSASGLGAVSGVTDASSLTWHKRSSVRNSTGQLDLEVWYALAPSGFNSNAITVTASNVVNGDTISFFTFGIGGGNQFGEIFDGNGSLPASGTSNSGSEIAVTDFSTANPNCVLLAYSANLSVSYAGADVRPFYLFNDIASAGPPANIAVEYDFTAEPAIADFAEFNITPTTWVALADALPVGPPSPPTGVMSPTEAKDVFASIGFLPAFGTFAATDQKDKATGAPAQAPYLSIGFIGWVPAFATVAATDQKDLAAMGGWVINFPISGRMVLTDAKDRMAASNIATVTGTMILTGLPDRQASAGFVLPKVPPSPPMRRRVLIIT